MCKYQEFYCANLRLFIVRKSDVTFTIYNSFSARRGFRSPLKFPRRGNLMTRTRRSFIFILSVPVATGFEKANLSFPPKAGRPKRSELACLWQGI